MPSTFWGLNIAVSGMSTYQAGLNTTSHNISNIGTRGYTRQYVEQSAKKALLLPQYGMLGAGVKVDAVLSSRDSYYDTKYWRNNAVLGNYSTKDYYMDSIQATLFVADEETGSLTTSFNKFFDAVTDLTNDESDTTLRKQVSIGGANFASYVNELANSLQTLQVEINNQIKIVADQVNAISEEIASLTKQINNLEVYGGRANDLRDQRAVLIDDLSQYASVTATEIPPAEEDGIVTFGNYILVDTFNYNTLVLEARTTRDNQNDAAGLYDISWSNGVDFPLNNKALGGTLQALLELRDGNNKENFAGELTKYTKGDAKVGGKDSLTITSSEKYSWPNATDLDLLNIPESKGVININNREYVYDYFEVEVKTDGTYVYTFALQDELTDKDETLLAKNVKDGVEAAIGDSVDYLGIPFYMGKINEFVRTFSATFNEVHNQGYDLYGNLGEDFFIGSNLVSGEQYDMDEISYNNVDKHYYLNGSKMITAAEMADYQQLKEIEADDDEVQTQAGTFYYVLDANGNKTGETVYVMNDDTRYTFSSDLTKAGKKCYYSMTALNFAVNDDIIRDGKLLACASENPLYVSGVADGRNLEKLYNLRSDKTIFREGNPVSFLQVVVATVGVDAKKVKDFAKNQELVVEAVEKSRLSVSGVYEDEEATNLIMLRNMLRYQYHVIDVQQEVLESLINMGA